MRDRKREREEESKKKRERKGIDSLSFHFQLIGADSCLLLHFVATDGGELVATRFVASLWERSVYFLFPFSLVF